MNTHHLGKIKRALSELMRSPAGIKAIELDGLARALGRQRAKRGKEPTYTRNDDPRLSPPLSIPGHAKELQVSTAKSIIRALLRDVAVWENYLQGGDDGEL